MLSIRSPYFSACTPRKTPLTIATLLFTALLSLPAAATNAAEYRYDHLGRLIQAIYSYDNNGDISEVIIDYTYDDAGNRLTQKVIKHSLQPL